MVVRMYTTRMYGTPMSHLSHRLCTVYQCHIVCVVTYPVDFVAFEYHVSESCFRAEILFASVQHVLVFPLH